MKRKPKRWGVSPELKRAREIAVEIKQRDGKLMKRNTAEIADRLCRKSFPDAGGRSKRGKVGLATGAAVRLAEKAVAWAQAGRGGKHRRSVALSDRQEQAAIAIGGSVAAGIRLALERELARNPDLRELLDN